MLSRAARESMQEADAVFVSPITFFEIGQKVDRGKWPDMAPYTDRLEDLLTEKGGLLAPLDARICLAASMMDWDHRDPFDRILAATAETLGLALVTKDPAFVTRPGLTLVW